MVGIERGPAIPEVCKPGVWVVDEVVVDRQAASDVIGEGPSGLPTEEGGGLVAMGLA